MSVKLQEQIKTTIRDFILSAIYIPDLAEDEKLFETGLVNSLFAVQLMTFVEKAFKIQVSMDDLDIKNFESISATAGFVLRKNGVVAAN
jgi:methoxymalonate biosynthesis acyl carrier protein